MNCSIKSVYFCFPQVDLNETSKDDREPDISCLHLQMFILLYSVELVRVVRVLLGLGGQQLLVVLDPLLQLCKCRLARPQLLIIEISFFLNFLLPIVLHLLELLSHHLQTLVKVSKKKIVMIVSN